MKIYTFSKLTNIATSVSVSVYSVDEISKYFAHYITWYVHRIHIYRHTYTHVPIIIRILSWQSRTRNHTCSPFLHFIPVQFFLSFFLPPFLSFFFSFLLFSSSFFFFFFFIRELIRFPFNRAALVCLSLNEREIAVQNKNCRRSPLSPRLALVFFVWHSSFIYSSLIVP